MWCVNKIAIFLALATLVGQSITSALLKYPNYMIDFHNTDLSISVSTLLRLIYGPLSSTVLVRYQGKNVCPIRGSGILWLNKNIRKQSSQVRRSFLQTASFSQRQLLSWSPADCIVRQKLAAGRFSRRALRWSLVTLTSGWHVTLPNADKMVVPFWRETRSLWLMSLK